MKHIGVQNGRKVAVLFRRVPGEPNNALVVFYEDLPSTIKANFDECLKSEDGQKALSLSDAAQRYSLGNGEKLLNALHVGNFIEKVLASSVTLTPNDKSSLSLSELNNILDGAGGAKAPTPAAKTVDPTAPAVPAGTNDVLSDADLAEDLRTQALQLQAEAARLLQEADELAPAPKKRGRKPKAQTA
jgi:hypothetical protein